MSSVAPEFCEFCTSAVSLVASAELIDDACTITLRVSRTLQALCNCIIEDRPFISFSMIAIALLNVWITSNNSFCDFSKSACSFARIAAAAFKSASVVVALPARSSILVWRDSLEAPSSDCQITRLRLAPSENVTTRNASLLSSLSQNGYGFPFFLHLPFVHLVFLDLIFSHLSLSRFVTHLICHWSHLSLLPLVCNN